MTQLTKFLLSFRTMTHSHTRTSTVPPHSPMLEIKVLDWEATREARLIGKADPVNLEHLLKSEYEQEIVVELLDDKGKDAGKLVILFQIVLKGEVEVTVIEGKVKDLGQVLTQQENYVKALLYSAESEDAIESHKTKVAKGLNPVFKKKNVLSFNYSGQLKPRLMLEVWDKEVTRGDRLVGAGAVDLTSKVVSFAALPSTTHTMTISLTDKTLLPAGTLTIALRFNNASYDLSKKVVRLGAGQLGSGSFKSARDLKSFSQADLLREFRVAAYQLEHELEHTAPEFLIDLAQKIKVPVYFLAMAFWGSIAAASLVVLVLLGAKVLSLLIGVIYPAYISFKAIESVGTDDDTQWLTYWVIFGVLTVLDETVFSLLTMINPVYGVMTFFFKIFTLIWLQHPKSRGAERVYVSYVGPFLRRNQAKVDKKLEKANKNLKEFDEKIRLPPTDQRASKRLSGESNKA